MIATSYIEAANKLSKNAAKDASLNSNRPIIIAFIGCIPVYQEIPK
jgi:hypothetical protein